MNSGHKNETATENSVTGSRRKFLQKTTAGVAIAVIPAKSVWARGGDGGIFNSIVASTHASGWTGDDMSLLSVGCWKNPNKFGSHSEDFNFNTVFNGNPLKNGAPVASFSYGRGNPASRPVVQSENATFLQVMKADGSTLDRVNSQICAMYLNAYFGGSSTVGIVGGLNFQAVNTVTQRPFKSLTDYADWLYLNAEKTSGFATALSNLIKDNHSGSCGFSE